MSGTIKVKTTDTFSLDALLSVTGGDPIDLSDYEIASQLRWGDELVADLLCKKGDQTLDPGRFVMSSDASTDWPAAVVNCDVRFTVDGVVKHSATFAVSIEKAVTR